MSQPYPPAPPEGGSPAHCSPRTEPASESKAQLNIQAVAAVQGLAPSMATMQCGNGLGVLDAATLRGMGPGMGLPGVPGGPGLLMGGPLARDLNCWSYANLWSAGAGGPLLGGMPGAINAGGLGMPAPDGQHGYSMLHLMRGMGGMALSPLPPPPPPPAVPGMRGHYITTSPDSKRPQATEINHNKAITKRLASAVHYQQARFALPSVCRAHAPCASPWV